MNRNYEKFFTPEHVAAQMADILDARAGDVILEPSAGRGALVRAVKNRNKNVGVYAVEINPEYEDDLRSVAENYEIGDFLLSFHDDDYHGCISNPPFGNGIDLQAHVDKIRSVVMLGRKIVMIVPADYYPGVPHSTWPIENWSTNSDGTTTAIKIICFKN